MEATSRRAVPYYRSVAIALVLLACPAAALAIRSAVRGEPRGAWLAVVALAVFLKIGHLGYYVPEWNYRISQGPWGRAIGQWVPPHWPIYTMPYVEPRFRIRHPSPCPTAREPATPGIRARRGPLCPAARFRVCQLALQGAGPDLGRRFPRRVRDGPGSRPDQRSPSLDRASRRALSRAASYRAQLAFKSRLRVNRSIARVGAISKNWLSRGIGIDVS